MLLHSVRDVTQRLRLWPVLRRSRAVLNGEVRAWLRRGCPSPAPGIVKIAIVRAYLKSHRIQRFVETGTFYGAMTDAIARCGVRVDTIELDRTLAKRAKRVFAARSNVNVHQGDSAVVIREILGTLKEPALFWLDAHWSGGVTARGEIDTPISDELCSILDHSVDHIVLIDDARHFLGTNGYPHLHELLAAIWKNGRYDVEVSTDIVRCVGKSLILRRGSLDPPDIETST